MLQELINTFEELKKYVFIVDRGLKESIVIRFNNDNFYHLVGLHKTNINMFFPKYIKTQDKKYKYMKSHIEKFEGILKNQIVEKDSLELRINTFHYLVDLLKSNDKTILYDLKRKVVGSMYDGDYGLLKIYEQIYCLLGLKFENKINNVINCAPQSWMASSRVNKLIEHRAPIFMEIIYAVPISVYNNSINEVGV